jgi:hypothetical protein
MVARSLLPLLPLLLGSSAIGCAAREASEDDVVAVTEEGVHANACQRSGTFVLDTPWSAPNGPVAILPVDEGSVPTTTTIVATDTPIVVWNLESGRINPLAVFLTQNGVTIAATTLVNPPATSTRPHDYLWWKAPHAELAPSLEPGTYALEANGLSLTFEVRETHDCTL